MDKVTKIQEIVAEYYKLTKAELLTKETKKFSIQRQVAMKLVYDNTAMSLRNIGFAFKRDQTAMESALNNVDNETVRNRDLRIDLVKLQALVVEKTKDLPDQIKLNRIPPSTQDQHLFI